jgi:hypothetical protein
VQCAGDARPSSGITDNGRTDVLTNLDFHTNALERVILTRWMPKSLFLWVFLVAIARLNDSLYAQDLEFGPLVASFPLTLDEGKRTEAAGPLFYSERKQTQKTFAVPPIFSTVGDPAVEMRETDFLYPALTYDRFGEEYRVQIFQLLSFSGGALQSGAEKHRFTLFPFYFQQRSPATNENYTAFWPVYGHLRNRLFRDEIDFALWPLYVKTKRKPGMGTVGADEFLSLGNRWAQSRRGDITTYNFIAPFFHLRYGDGLRGWQAWPLAGHEIKAVTTRTNAWGDAESIPGFEKEFILWPLWLSESRETGSTNQSEFRALLPFFTSLRSPGRDSTSYLWPVGLTLTDDRARKYRETDFLWPVFVYARGEGKTSTRVWPLFGRAHNDILESNFYLWPLYKYSRAHSEAVDRERTRILLFLYSDTRQQNTLTAKTARRVDLWPLFTHSRDLEGSTRLQVFAPLEPILSKSKSIERNYSPIWSVWRSARNATNGAASDSLLWNLYRRDSANGENKTSLLFGLFQRTTGTNGSGLRLLFIPLKKPRDPGHAAVVAHDEQMAQFPGAAEH